MKLIIRLFLILLLTFNYIFAQFLPQIGFGTNDAIQKDDTKIKSWATGCTLTRGWKNITNKTLGYASFGSETDGIGAADGASTVSLGDSGVAILTFSKPIINGIGADFAVFENAFLYQNQEFAFLELAFVEVSSNGIDYYRFPAISNTDISTQISGFQYLDATKLHNLAGKYISNYGTPFDLEELITISGLDVNQITHVKIIDVIGNINSIFAQKDSKNQIINDPFPTPFSTCGFDLDAIAVLNQSNSNDVTENKIEKEFEIFPTILKNSQIITIRDGKNIQNLVLINIFNQQFNEYKAELIDNQIKIILNQQLVAGIYFLNFYDGNQYYSNKILIE